MVELKILLKKRISSFDYSPEGRYIYYVEKITPQSSGGGFLNSVWNSIFGKNARMMRVELATGNIEEVRKFNISGHESEIRRGVDDKLYINKLPSQILNFLTPQYISELKYYYDLDDATASAVGASESTLNLGFGNNNWGLPLQPYRRYLKAEEAAHCGEYASRKKGDRVYEVSDHLSNVRVVIGDIRESNISTTVPTTIEAFYPEVKSWTDYTAFGSEMPGRTAQTKDYRYGFNGMEKDDEIKDVSGSSYDFGARIYDSRVGRWLSVDPLAAKHPDVTPYNFVGNSPLVFIDPDGKDWTINVTNQGGVTKVEITLDVAVINSSSTPFNMADLEKAIKTQVESSYSFTDLQAYSDNRSNGGPSDVPKIGVFKVETKVNIRTVNNKAQLKTNEHVIEVLDAANPEVKGVYGRVNKIGGKKVSLNANYVADIIAGKDKNTVVHELGHTLGLLHVDTKATKDTDESFWSFDIKQYMDANEQAKNPNNAMFSGGSAYMNDLTSTEITKKQIEVAIEEYNDGDINLD